MLISNIHEAEDLVIGPGEGMQPMSILWMKNVKNLFILIFSPLGSLDKKWNEMSNTPVKYFNQRLLNYKQKF